MTYTVKSWLIYHVPNQFRNPSIPFPRPHRSNAFVGFTRMNNQPVEWLATLTAEPLGLGSNPGEEMDVCKCIVPSRHGGTLNSRRVTSPLVRLVEG
ncbi:hypothetical protein TNCV_5089911 [Trichonephila clavipes]|nr:hypothetical protein TNCV_5089911 [Trichonephila clavipes]